MIWLCNLLEELSFPQGESSLLYEDNQACVVMVNNHVFTGHIRNFCVKMNWLCQQVTDKLVKFQFVYSRNNVADIFTKILALG